MKNFYPVLFLFAAQCHEPACVTDCGMIVQDLKGYTCEGVQDVETRTVLALRKTADPRLQKTDCSLLKGVKLEFMDTERWVEPDGMDVRGRYFCGPRVMRVGKDPCCLRHSSMSHEIAHVLQDCVSLPPYGDDPAHSNWVELGLYDAFAEVSNDRVR